MNPSEVRSRVLAEHAWVRQKVDHLEGAAERCIYGMPGELPRMQAALHDLAGVLEMHLSTEEEILLPCLREVDAWGDLRADRLHQEHQAQRREIRELERLAHTSSQEQVAKSVLEYCQALRHDMDGEERVTLSPTLLRDDVVAMDQLDA